MSSPIGDPGTPIAAGHPLYLQWAPVWRKLAHVYEGDGGFLDGSYIIPHPREYKDFTSVNPTTPTKKLTLRRQLARYENLAEAIISAKQSALFRQPIIRRIGKDDDTAKQSFLWQWWRNVDGDGCSIDDYMALTWPACAVFGHVFHVMDREQMEAPPQTKADEPQPFLRTYAPLDTPDWLTDAYGRLTAVKFIEGVVRTTLQEPAEMPIRYRYRILTDTQWQITEENSSIIAQGDHGFGVLPVVPQYANRRAIMPVVGKSVLNDPQLFIDLYNLISENRELFRNQVFSLLNVPIGTGDQATDIEKVKDWLAGEAGTENVLFTPIAAQFIQADAANVKSYQDERNLLTRTIYRLCQIPWESDTKDAESTGSLKMKREEMNTVLSRYATECQKAEYAIAKLRFRAEYGPDRWEDEWDAADVTIEYPDTFDPQPFAELLEQAQAAVALDMPPVFMRELRKMLVGQFLPNLTPSQHDEINADIEQQATQAASTQIGEMKQRLQGMGAKELPTQAQLNGTAAI